MKHRTTPRRAAAALALLLGAATLGGCHLETDAQGLWLQCDPSDYTMHLDEGGDRYWVPNHWLLYAVGCQGGYLGGPSDPPRYPRIHLAG